MINNIVVVGSGVMGRGIAYVGAVGGYSVTLVDRRFRAGRVLQLVSSALLTWLGFLLQLV